MIRRIFSPPAIACGLVAIGLAALTLGPFMRDTDQAWLLDGGMGFANGHPEIPRGEFNFDKQFVSYCLPGILFRFLPRPFTADTLVLAGNILGMFLFWGAMFWLLARSSRRLPLALALPVILTPSFLVYSPFYASAFTSAAFVILLAVFLDREKWGWWRHGGVFLLAFCAVGARADVIVLLPLLAMLHSPRRTFASVLRSPNTWLMAASGPAVFVLGRALYTGNGGADLVPLVFRLKQYLGHVAFGLGGATLVLLAALHAIWRAGRAGRCRLWPAFLWLGVALPMCAYSFQLVTPRHCTVGAVSILLFICARRGRAIFNNYFRQRFFRPAVKTAFVLSALVPVFLGVNLADIRHPKITGTRPTLLPSGAGVAPAGAYLAFARDIRRHQGFIDHNHAIWAAAKSTRFEAGADDKVPYLSTPVESYLILAMHLQGRIPDAHSLPCDHCPAKFYLESRSLMRFQFLYPPQKVSMEEFFATTALTPATEVNWHGITMLRGDTSAPVPVDSPTAALWAFNTIFGPDEFRLEPVESLQKIPDDWAGKKLVLVSREKLAVSARPDAHDKVVAGTTTGNWHVCEISPLRAGEAIGLETMPAQQVFAAISAFPEWMSLQKL